jgi:hypothetical protein
MSDDGIRGQTESTFRLSRLNIFLFDFRMALRFAQYILKRKWPATMNDQSRSRLIYQAFTTSLIVSYSRPFHKSNEGVGLRPARLRPDVGILDDAERGFHKMILDKRDQAYAHSDASAHELKGFDYSASTFSFYKLAFEPLTKAETLMLTKIIRKWISYVKGERVKLRVG